MILKILCSTLSGWFTPFFLPSLITTRYQYLFIFPFYTSAKSVKEPEKDIIPGQTTHLFHSRGTKGR